MVGEGWLGLLYFNYFLLTTSHSENDGKPPVAQPSAGAVENSMYSLTLLPNRTLLTPWNALPPRNMMPKKVRNPWEARNDEHVDWLNLKQPNSLMDRSNQTISNYSVNSHLVSSHAQVGRNPLRWSLREVMPPSMQMFLREIHLSQTMGMTQRFLLWIGSGSNCPPVAGSSFRAQFKHVLIETTPRVFWAATRMDLNHSHDVTGRRIEVRLCHPMDRGESTLPKADLKEWQEFILVPPT